MVPVPPVATTLPEYTWPDIPLDRLDEEKFKVGTVMMITYELVEVPQVASLTITSRLKVPCMVGMPEMVLPDAIKPGGSPEIDHMGAVQAVPLHVAVKLAL